MAGLAHGGHAPVFLMTTMGISALFVGALIDPVLGLVPLFGISCLMIAAFFVNFWRDPDRPIPRDLGVLVSPADGHVMFVRRERATGRRPSKLEMEKGEIDFDEITGDWFPKPLDEPLSFATEQRYVPVKKGEEDASDVLRVAVFMSPLDVHVNRAPEKGILERLEHRAGKGMKRGPFAPAYKKESQYNERVRSVYRLGDDTLIELTQISGALARTIIPWIGEGTPVRRGQRIGMIRLGSRVDVRVPAHRYTCDLISAESGEAAFPKGVFVQAGSTVMFRTKGEEEE
ncbi:MAG TPA: phosphatidylserine decarboxylase [Poseidonia sp.]|nr:phosphatidylserine decarboxylase [Poseidonia sp.]